MRHNNLFYRFFVTSASLFSDSDFSLFNLFWIFLVNRKNGIWKWKDGQILSGPGFEFDRAGPVFCLSNMYSMSTVKTIWYDFKDSIGLSFDTLQHYFTRTRTILLLHHRVVRRDADFDGNFFGDFCSVCDSYRAWPYPGFPCGFRSHWAGLSFARQPWFYQFYLNVFESRFALSIQLWKSLKFHF